MSIVHKSFDRAQAEHDASLPPCAHDLPTFDELPEDVQDRIYESILPDIGPDLLRDITAVNPFTAGLLTSFCSLVEINTKVGFARAAELGRLIGRDELVFEGGEWRMVYAKKEGVR